MPCSCFPIICFFTHSIYTDTTSLELNALNEALKDLLDGIQVQLMG